MDAQARDELARQFGNIASEAGRFIVSGFPQIHISTKPDGSPVSDADTGAENLIRAQLGVILPGVAILGEESFNAVRDTAMPPRFVLVDPIDGTRDFVAGGDQYTVNIALIDEGQPVVGCVFAPALDRMYVSGARAFRATLRPGQLLRDRGLQLLATRPHEPDVLRAVVSRSHMDLEQKAELLRLGVKSRHAFGSSLKFCAVAQSDADVYPRLGDTMEWDTAAGHAVLLGAGGCVLARDGSPLRYGKPGFRNKGFIAWAREPA